MANVSFEDVLDLADEFITALDDLPADFKANNVGKAELTTKREAYATKLATRRSQRRQLQSTTGECKAMRRDILQVLVNLRSEAKILYETNEALPKMPGSGASGGDGADTDTTTTTTS